MNNKLVVRCSKTVGEGTQHGWSKLVGFVSSHVQEEACARSEASKGASEGKENKKARQRDESSRQKLLKKDCLWPRRVQKDDVIEVFNVSSDSEVFSVSPTPDSLASSVSVFLLIVIEYTYVPCGPQQFVSQIEEHLCYESILQSPQKGERRAATARMITLHERQRQVRLRKHDGDRQSRWGAKMDEEAWYRPVGHRRGREILLDLSTQPAIRQLLRAKSGCSRIQKGWLFFLRVHWEENGSSVFLVRGWKYRTLQTGQR